MDIPDTLLPGQYAIYALVDPTDEKVYYVGQTRNPQRRLGQHLAARHYEGDKGEWLRRLSQQGQQPLMKILETVIGEKAALEKEQEWIRHYVEKKMPLLNVEAQPKRNNARPYSLPMAEVRYIPTIIAGAPPLIAVRLPDGELGVTLRSLCNLLDLNQRGQIQRIRRNSSLAEALQEAIISTPGGSQQAEVLLNWAISIWAAGLQTTRLPEAKRAAVKVLQREAFAALERAFTQPRRPKGLYKMQGGSFYEPPWPKGVRSTNPLIRK